MLVFTAETQSDAEDSRRVEFLRVSLRLCGELQLALHSTFVSITTDEAFF
jgi:hypothetical protein